MTSIDSSSEEEGPPNRRNKMIRSKKHQERVSSIFNMDESSSSSSDEFERVPECLDDLGDIDFKTKVKNSPLKTSTPTASDIMSASESQSKDVVPQVDYYDFSKILQSQQELKDVAEKMATYTDTQTKDESSPKRNTSSKGRKGTRKGRSARKPPGRDCSNPDQEIDELLKVGERIETKPKSRNLKRTFDDSAIDEDMVLVSEQLDSDGNDDDEEPIQDVEITIALPSVHLKRKKYRELRNQMELARKYNESRRIFQVDLHKGSVLGCLAHGFFLNNLANTDDLHALALSVIPNKSFYAPSVNTLSYTEKITKWFNKKYPIDYSKTVVSLDIVVEDFSRAKASSLPSLVVMFVALCRQLGLKCRLMIALQPCPIKPPASEMMKIPKENEEADGDDGISESPKKKAKGKATSCEKIPGGKSTINSRTKPSTSSKKQKNSESTKASKQQSDSKAVKNKSKKTPNEKNSPRNSSGKKSNRKVLSSDDSDEDEPVNDRPAKKGVDYWAEVYLEAEEIWVPADVARGQVHNATAIGNGVTGNLGYVVAWNSDSSIKDLTRRYASNWLTTTPKFRAEPKWWKKTLAPWAPRNTKLEKLENKKLDEEEAATPIPSKIQDCKNHPFYALKRHLLKYEAIYPPDAKPIGYIRGEAVYARVCVSELHTKETWMRQGKALRVNEEPYKIVKARPKWDKVSSTVVKDLPLPLFGYWQVDDYIAPPAVDGIVPKNEYGNVELYRPSMLPAGTVHLQVPGLPKVARKLGIDFAPAVVGWEYHGGSSHPCIDGVIVCKEHQDTLLDAWNASVDNDIEKEKSKSHVRAVKNWKKLIRSVIIRRRIEKKYKLNLSNVNV
ncbi:hypothetical protein GE061_000459 [Apolygus lucorum]|uniref:Rad4 beta-hairpin domain-containing protein n=1 Tax=Apolygus lucorum TaxID=248454 RepID=A0A6A4K9Y3_APOLU|nr:hypothetical protein GE061_000459 [Apolygus lucorum]